MFLEPWRVKDVTEEIVVEPKARVAGKHVRDELHHNGVRVGYVEPQGWLLDHRNYLTKFVPTRNNVYELRIYKLLDHEREALAQD